MQFSLIIGNPPYNQNLDLKILKDVYELSERTCFVHPVGWLYDNKNINRLFKSTRELISNHLPIVDIFDGSDIFGIQIHMPLCITLFDKQYDSELINVYDKVVNQTYKSTIDNIDKHGYSKSYISFKNKILQYCKQRDTVLQHVNIDDNNINDIKKWVVGHSPISPVFSIDCIIAKHTENIGLTTNYSYKYYFDTQQEAINFRNYLKTKFARACLGIFKINQCLHRGELGSIPYMPTYLQSWTDEQCANEVGITREELSEACDKLAKYYPED
jgi:hypothetical protein